MRINKANGYIRTRMRIKRLTGNGFTLIEIMIVMVIIGILAATLVYNSSRNAKSKTYLNRAEAEVVTIANAIKLKVQESNVYPADVNRDLPPGIEQYIGTPNDEWPDAPWPGTVYDYENWDSGNTIQISIRFCDVGDNATCKANAQKYLKGVVSDSVLNAWDAKSSVYFCIKEGSCRSHQDNPVTHPGYRINISTSH